MFKFEKAAPVFLIAEIGINHNGDLQIAKRLIDAAFATGWDCVKFQKRTPELCVPPAQRDLPRSTPWGEMTYLDYKKRIEFGLDEYKAIDEYCKAKPILWTASPWDVPSVDFLGEFDVPFIKVPSAKLTDLAYLAACCKTGKPVLASVGMSTVKEIDEAVDVLEEYATSFALMYTNSTYPTPPNEMNLKCIPWLIERYGCVVGYSGHEFDLEGSVIAHALGARIIERHVTLDRTMWGTDQSSSLEVHAMDMLRKRLRDVDTMLGDGVKRVTAGEEKIKEKLRG